MRDRATENVSDWLYSRLMELTTSDEATKVQLFRFVDVLPSLKTPHAIAQHASEFLSAPDVKLPPGAHGLLTLLTRTSITERLLSGAMTFGTGLMARRFIAGRDAAEATAGVMRLRQQNMGFTLDLLGEAVTSEADAIAYQRKYFDLIRDLPRLVEAGETSDQIETAPWGALPRPGARCRAPMFRSSFLRCIRASIPWRPMPLSKR